MTSLLGLPLDQADVPTFLSLTRLAFAVLLPLVALKLARQPAEHPTGRLVLLVAATGHFLAWLGTMAPLPNVYGANGSMDRENHLGWANMVAEGFSPLRTFQVNHLHFEPVWPLLSAIASGFEIDRVALVFQWAPLIMGLALLASVRRYWPGEGGGRGTEVEAAFAALGALLLMATPTDFSGTFRNPWAMTFLLKPNHALGLVLIPLAAAMIARAHSWKSRVLAGFALQLVGWAFIIHMALFAAGLAVFAALSWLERRPDRRKDLLDVVAAIGVNLIIVSPYLVMLVSAYPFLRGDSPPVPFLSERPLESPMRMGGLLLASSLGAWRTYRRGDRLGRLLSAQWLGAQIAWQVFPALSLIGQAREQDEVFYWSRFWIGIFAGVGALEISRWALPWVGRGGKGAPLQGPAPAAALALILTFPSLLPAWWDPLAMDQYFVAARRPLPDWIAEPTRFIRENTARESVFAGDRNYARWIAAYGARRVLMANSMNAPGDAGRRAEIETALLRDGDPALWREGRIRYGIEYLLVTSNPLEQAPDVTIDQLAANRRLEPVFDRRFAARRVAIFKTVPTESMEGR